LKTDDDDDDDDGGGGDDDDNDDDDGGGDWLWHNDFDNSDHDDDINLRTKSIDIDCENHFKPHYKPFEWLK